MTTPNPESQSDVFSASWASCGSEPVHLIGATQDYGALVVLDAQDNCVQASANVHEILGIEAHELVGSAWSDVCRRYGVTGVEHPSQTLSIGEQRSCIGLGFGREHPRQLDVLVHRLEAMTLVELEAHQKPSAALSAGLLQLHRAVRRLHDTPDLPALLDALVAEVRHFSGFDRAMIYRFDAGWNGSVAAESLAPGMHSYLGQHFPASDIPPPARAIFSKTWVRVIPDVAAPSHALVPPSAPHDLSVSTLRAPAPVHLVYLRNMQVQASLTLSLLLDGRLWGLVACHHAQPRHISLTQRQEAELLARVTSSLLKSKRDDGLAQKRAELSAHVAAWTQEARKKLPEGLAQASPSLLELGAPQTTGALVCYEQRMVSVGRVPPETFCRELVAWLTENHDSEESFEEDALASVFAPAAEHQAYAAGVLAIPIGRGNWVMWLRPEAVRTVQWAGKPDEKLAGPKGAEGPFTPQMLPRRSFALWRETVHQRAEPFDSPEREASALLRKNLTAVALDAQLRRQEETLASVVRQRQRMGFLAQAAQLLGRSLAHDALLGELMPLILESFADWLALELLSENQWRVHALAPSAVAVANASAQTSHEPITELCRDLPAQETPRLQRLCTRTDDDAGVARATLWRDSDALLKAVAHDEVLTCIAGHGLLGSSIAAPLRILGEVRGYLVVGREASRTALTSGDCDVLSQLAQMLGSALSNAQLYREAQEATRGRDHVLGVVSHDLRNPLGVIKLSSELLHRRVKHLGDAERPRLTSPLNRIDSACERMQRLIDDVLSLAKVEGGGLLIDPQPTPISALLSEAVHMFEPLAQAQNVHLECAPPLEQALTLNCDFERMMQVLGNLIGNAIKFTPEGGRVRLSSSRRERDAWIEVADDGPGIAPSEVPHVFDRFWQAKKSARQGAGLGLAIAKGIVEAHGGSIGVAHSSAKGSTFAFSCPLSA